MYSSAFTACWQFCTELPTWENVERALGADRGIHTLLTATAVDDHQNQVGKPLFLDTGGFDGRQARTRRQIDTLKKTPGPIPGRDWFEDLQIAPDGSEKTVLCGSLADQAALYRVLLKIRSLGLVLL